MALDPRKLFPGARDAARAAAAANERASAPLDGTRAERVQRVQVGLFGLGAMMLLVGLADIVITRAQETQANAVPEAAPTTPPTDAPKPRDPLADAGVVPELPAEPDTQSPGAQSPGGQSPNAQSSGVRRQDVRRDVPPPTR